MYDILHTQLKNRKEPIDLIVVGVGFMGFGFLSSIAHTPGIRVPLVISRRPRESRVLLKSKGLKVYSQDVSSVSEIKKLCDQGYICVSDDIGMIKKYDNNTVVEMTGTVDYGTEVALTALKSHKNLITMNPELQVSVGSELHVVADTNKVVVTDVYGDQPGSLARMISQAQLMGFKVRMAGNMKRYMDKHATQKKMKPWADDKGLAVRQTTSFTDGTKQAIEMELVGNYFGMKPLQKGMVGPRVNKVHDVLKKFNWDDIPAEGVVDYVIGIDLFPGVFLVVEHPDPNQQRYLRYLGLGDGPQYVLFEPYHLCHLEVVETVLKVELFGQETIDNTIHPINKTYAVAKRTLQQGDHLDGIGGDTVYGEIDTIQNTNGLLPIGLSHHAIVKHDIKKDTPISLDDVILPVNTATRLTGLTKEPSKLQQIGSLFYRVVNLF